MQPNLVDPSGASYVTVNIAKLQLQLSCLMMLLDRPHEVEDKNMTLSGPIKKKTTETYLLLLQQGYISNLLHTALLYL